MDTYISLIVMIMIMIIMMLMIIIIIIIIMMMMMMITTVPIIIIIIQKQMEIDLASNVTSTVGSSTIYYMPQCNSCFRAIWDCPRGNRDSDFP